MKRVLVTGSSGYIGNRLIRGLLERSDVAKVVGLDVKPSSVSHPNFVFVEQDIRDPLDDLIRDHEVNVIAHLAYILPPIHDTALMEDINRGGTINVLESAARCGVNQILYTSSATAYGFYPDNPIPLTEDSPLRGNADFTYAKNKREIEGIIAEFKKRNPSISITILRPCFVVGPGFDNPLARHLCKKVVLLPSNMQPFQFVHEDDLLELMLHFVETGTDGIYNVAGEGTISFREMVANLGGHVLALPYGVMYALNAVAWKLRMTFLTEFPSPALNLIACAWLVTSEKLIRETGYKFKYDTLSAFADFVRHVKAG
jgi:UDP-glucose 4-epimerase